MVICKLNGNLGQGLLGRKIVTSQSEISESKSNFTLKT